METISNAKNPLKRAFVFIGISLVLLLISYWIEHFSKLAGYVLGHISVAFLVAAIIYVTYERLHKIEEEKRLQQILDHIKEDVFSAAVGTFVPKQIKASLLEILKQTNFIKKDVVVRYNIKMNKSNSKITHVEKIYEYSIKNITNKERQYTLRLGFQEKGTKELECKIEGKKVTLKKSPKPKKNMGAKTQESYTLINLAPKEEKKLVMFQKTKSKPNSVDFSNNMFFLEPCLGLTVKVTSPIPLNKFDIDVFAYADGDFINDENIIHSNHLARKFEGCVLPFQGFSIEGKLK